MAGKHVEPSVYQSAFSCPHCGTLTTQYWSEAVATNFKREKKNAAIYSATDLFKLEETTQKTEMDRVHKIRLSELINFSMAGIPRLSRVSSVGNIVSNIKFTECYNCNEFAVWINEALIWPESVTYPAAHMDMPEGIRREYDEAGSILAYSPRGAAALLRLALQKLLPLVGGKGKKIDDDIGLLVKNGLDERVQKMLDTVRVIGNEAVHPGSMDISDNVDTAMTLFKIINLIVERLITQPRMIDEMYSSLPPEKLRGIENRDKKE